MAVGVADTCSSIFSEPNRHHLREFSLLTADVLLEEGSGEGRGIYTRVHSHSSPQVIGNFKRGLKEELEYTAGRDWSEGNSTYPAMGKPSSRWDSNGWLLWGHPRSCP